MPIQFDNYDQQKIDRLKNHLSLLAEKGKPKYYEIFVDTLKAVPKTDEPKEFDGYEDYLAADTEQIKLVIYDTASSPRNDQYVFVMKARNREEALNLGLGSITNKSYTQSSLNTMREGFEKRESQAMELQALRKENTELKKELEEAEKYADELAAAVEAAKANGNKIGGVHWGEVMSVALEGLLKRNTHIIAQIPGVAGLAGIIDKDNSKTPESIPSAPDAEISFKRKSSEQSQPELTDQEKEFLNLLKELQNHFTVDELGQIMEILDVLSRDKTQLTPALELLQGK
jgi:hypothetical protein